MLRSLWDDLTRPRSLDADEARSESLTRAVLIGLVVVTAALVPVFWVLW